MLKNTKEWIEERSKGWYLGYYRRNERRRNLKNRRKTRKNGVLEVQSIEHLMVEEEKLSSIPHIYPLASPADDLSEAQVSTVLYGHHGHQAHALISSLLGQPLNCSLSSTQILSHGQSTLFI